MKTKYITLALLPLAALFTACEEEEGTVPGNDSQPKVTLYSYTPDAPYDTDNDIRVRVAANSKATEIYYLAEETEKTNEYIKSKGENAFYEKVIAEGKKVDVAPAETGDVYVTGMFGQNTITFVAVNGGSKTASTLSFYGYTWNTISTGTYTFSEKAQSRLGIASAATELQVNADDSDALRFKNLWGSGKHMYINKTEFASEDKEGNKYTFIRVPSQTTPFEFSDYGNINVRDVAEWQGDDSYVTSSLGAVLYDDGSYAYIVAQYFVSAGSLGYGADEYVAAE